MSITSFLSRAKRLAAYTLKRISKFFRAEKTAARATSLSPKKQLSLLETANCDPSTFLLVYTQNGQRRAWWTFWLPRGLDHIDVWRPIGGGFHLAIAAYHDRLSIELIEGEPSGVVQRVVARRPRGKAMLPFGLKTCVTLAKAALGIRAPWVVTPRQLFRYVQKRNGVV